MKFYQFEINATIDRTVEVEQENYFDAPSIVVLSVEQIDMFCDALKAAAKEAIEFSGE